MSYHARMYYAGDIYVHSMMVATVLQYSSYTGNPFYYLSNFPLVMAMLQLPS